MSKPQMRPRFEFIAPVDCEALLDKLEVRLKTPGSRCVGARRGHHVEIKIPAAERHFWSPQLNLEVRPHDTGTHIHGLYSPRADVWTLFVAMYAVCAFAAFVGTMFGYSQWTLDQPPLGFWALPAAGGAAALIYAASLFGQSLSATHMARLAAFLSVTVEIPAEKK